LLRFGTDGVRGVALREITPNAVFAFARAAARALRCTRVVVGHDPRESSPELARAVVDGFRAEGVDTLFVGMAPTPAIAYLAERMSCAAAVVTASHNPYTDNGLKFFRVGGTKLDDAEEASVQALFEQLTTDGVTYQPIAGDPQVVGLEAYAEHVVDTSTGVPAGLRVVVDCANGAMSEIAPSVLRRLGADVTVVNASPDGRNINVACGAAHPEALSAAVREHPCDLGIAFDGDGDRLIACTSSGEIVDGDHLIAMSAVDMKSRGALANDTVAVTVMTNVGFHRAMKQHDIDVVTTPVGDRSVMIALESNGLSLGGEQSGHIIHRDLATTGDGLLAAVQLFGVLSRAASSLGDVSARAMTSFPQVLINVSVSGSASELVARCSGVIASVEADLGGEGRVLVRPSGTEPLVRVMVEAATHAAARAGAERIAAAIADSPAASEE
jgi:phosphoglucosamine mutase